MIGDQLLLHEEITLLRIHEQKGALTYASQHSAALAAAILAELILQRRVGLEGTGRKTVIRPLDSRLLGDPLLDEALELIRSRPRALSATNWNQRLASRGKLVARANERLYLAGLVRKEERSLLIFFTRTVLLTTHSKSRQRIIEKLRSAAMTDDAVDERTAVLVALVRAADLLPHVLDRRERRARKKRLQAIVQSHATAAVLAGAVNASRAHAHVVVVSG